MTLSEQVPRLPPASEGVRIEHLHLFANALQHGRRVVHQGPPGVGDRPPGDAIGARPVCLDRSAVVAYAGGKQREDSFISLNGVVYEVDAALVGEKVTLRFDRSAPSERPVQICHQGTFIELARSVQTYANCFVKPHIFTDLKTLTGVWMGDLRLGQALRKQKLITVSGEEHLKRGISAWLGTNYFADVKPARKTA